MKNFKNMHDILSNLRTQKEFERLNSLEIINNLVATLPYNLRKFVLFSSLKGATLFVAFSHPASCSEFNNYKKDLMLQNLKNIRAQLNLEGEIARIRQIQGYVPMHILNGFNVTKKYGAKFEENKGEKIATMVYKERAKGDFELDSKSAFYEIFNDIRIAIKRNNESS